LDASRAGRRLAPRAWNVRAALGTRRGDAGRAVKAFLASAAGQRVWLERLPSYAPDLNPVEGIWHHLKHLELGNVCCYDAQDLRQEMGGAFARLPDKHDVLLGCLNQCA
jgi:transposase